VAWFIVVSRSFSCRGFQCNASVRTVEFLAARNSCLRGRIGDNLSATFIVYIDLVSELDSVTSEVL
jgi:hypothetical protein